jgi:hypothetical protein
VVVTSSEANGADRVTAIGETEATNKPMDVHHLERLEHLRGLLPSSKIGSLPKLLLFSRIGFSISISLRKQGDARSDVELIDLHRLYGGG